MSRRAPTSALRAAVLCISAGVLCWPFTLGAGRFAASAAAALASLVADRLQAQRFDGARLRASGALGGALLAALVASALGGFLLDSSAFGSGLGPERAYAWVEVLRWFALAGAAVFALRFVAGRYPAAALFEVVLVAAAFVAVLAAHRNGMVHRPWLLGDWAWSRGLDPAVVFLALGVACTCLLAALLVREERRARLPLHFAVFALIGLALVAVVRLSGLPQPQSPAGLGLTGEPHEGLDGEGSGERRSTDADMDFRSDYDNRGGEAPVAVVLLHDDYRSPSGVYYFRQSAFSQYNGRRLVQSTRDDVDGDIVRRFPSEPIRIAGAPPIGAGRMALRTTVGLLLDHVQPFALDSPAALRPSQNPNPLRFQRTFEVVSHVPTRAYADLLGRRPGSAEWSAEQWEHYTEPPGDPRFSELARKIVAGLRPEYAADPLARALALKLYLDEHGIYSRRNRHADENDPTASFLFGDLTGYCVHFAHASAYLLRSMGLPARVAAGYAVPDDERGDGAAVLIRGLNAHAWPELYLDGEGWVAVDPSPERSLDELAPEADRALQQLLGDMLRPQPRPDELPPDSQPVDWLAPLARALLALLCGAILLGAAVKAYRRLAPRVTGPADAGRVGYRAALDRLSEVGLRRAYGESRERFAARARSLAPSFGSLTSEHLHRAWSREREADVPHVRSLLSALRDELAQAVPVWRRWLGWLDPFCWWWSR